MIFQNCLKFHPPNGSEIAYNNFETSLVVFMPNITTNHAITYTNFDIKLQVFEIPNYEISVIGVKILIMNNV